MTDLWIERELERRLEAAAEVEGRVWLEQDEAAEVLDALAAARVGSTKADAFISAVDREIDAVTLRLAREAAAQSREAHAVTFRIGVAMTILAGGALSALSWVLS